MEGLTVNALQLALLAWGCCTIGVIIGWFMASMFTCGKMEDLERENKILRRELGLQP